MSSSWPLFEEDEIAAVERVLRSGRVNYWTGSEGSEFEREFAAYLGVPYAVAVANGTVALELALRSLGIGPGDDVLVPARTFIASATAVVAVGARPVIVDVDRESGVVCADTLGESMTARTKAVIVVHLGGWACDMGAIMAFTQSQDLKVIEDCAQAHGARWAGRSVGSFGHASAFSFCTDKILSTCGEGGMLVTNDSAVWRRAWEYKDHGRTHEALEKAGEQGGYEFKWLIESFGTNWRMTEMQAAVGRVQLRKLDKWVAHRRANAAVLDERLSGITGLRVEIPPVSVQNSYYKYYAYVRPEMLAPGWDRSRILMEVNGRGIACGQGICPEIYRERAFVEASIAPDQRLAAARELGETSLMLQVDQTLTPDDMHDSADVIASVMSEAAGKD